MGHVAAHGLPRWCEAEKEAGHDRQRESETHGPEVDVGAEVDRQPRGRNPGGQQVRAPGGHDEASHAAQQRQQHALHQELPQQISASRADGEADGDLTPARDAASEQQPGEVRAGEEQHQGGDRAQHEEDRTEYRRAGPRGAPRREEPRHACAGLEAVLDGELP
jgi:hypothetical protein